MSEEFLRFLAHSCELEQEAQYRYSELAQALGTHNNTEVAAFFARMADEASHHLAEVSLLAVGEALPEIAPWEFDWPGNEAPETLSHEAVNYRMDLREAMSLALQMERSAERFYREAAARAEDARTRELATEFADEERGHAASLELMLQDLPEVSETARMDEDPPHMPE